MAVNDPVNFYANASNTFQPAAGVQIMILTAFSYSTDSYFGITNGVTNASNYSNGAYLNRVIGSKYIITNTDYWYVSGIGTEKGFSGIQIK